MPASIKLQETFGDDLQVVFVQSQQTTGPESEAFAIARKWMGGRAMWSMEHPFETGSNTLPNFVLLGNDGKVLLKGNPLDQPKEIERQIAEQIKLARSAPADTNKSVKPAWAEFNKGKIAKAFELVRALSNDPAGKEDVIAAAKETLAAFDARLQGDLKRIDWMLENGFFEEAANLADSLKKNVKGDAELEKQVGASAAKLDAPEIKAERDAAKAFSRLVSKYYQSGGDPAVKKDLEAFAKKNAATKAGSRADHLVKLPKGSA